MPEVSGTRASSAEVAWNQRWVAISVWWKYQFPNGGRFRFGTMTVQSIERAIDLLELLAEEPAKLVELSVESGLPVSTVARLLNTLQDLSLIHI